ncbi:MAG: Tim44/TimA family putative adaptor protein [Aestuariivita sp.]|nr:Tim44/TimA family putative adaptor protein [Aestuariivita sp.]
MNSSMIQILVLAGVALFLILRLRSVLGTRQGFEKLPQREVVSGREDAEVYEAEEGRDYEDVAHSEYVESGSDAEEALHAMERVDSSFSFDDFVHGARQAYEMIVLGFEHGDINEIAPYLGQAVRRAFASNIAKRKKKGVTVKAEFIGIHEASVQDVVFDHETSEAQITMKFRAEMNIEVRNRENEEIRGKQGTLRRLSDTWVFERIMKDSDPNWKVVATAL